MMTPSGQKQRERAKFSPGKLGYFENWVSPPLSVCRPSSSLFWKKASVGNLPPARNGEAARERDGTIKMPPGQKLEQGERTENVF